MFNPNNTRLQNRIHINFALEKEGEIIKKSVVMINIFEWDVKRAANLYSELLRELGEAPVTIPKTENNKPIQLNTKNIEFFTAPECPDHKVPMVMRTRKSDGFVFFGCPMYKNGCKRTAQHPINQEMATKIPSISPLNDKRSRI